MIGDEIQQNIKEGVKGAILWEEPELDLHKRRTFSVLAGNVWIILWSLGLFIMWFLEFPGFIIFAGIAAVGVVLFYNSISILPHIIYENGVEYGRTYPPFFREYRTFISWGEMSGLGENKKRYFFECPKNRNIVLDKESPGITRIVNSVKDRVDKEEYLIYVDLDERIRRMKRKELMVYPCSFLFSLGFYFVFAFLLYGPRYVNRVGMSLYWMIAPALSVLFALFFLYEISTRRRKEKIKVKIDLRAFGIFFVIMCLIYYANLDIETVMRHNDPPWFNYSFGQTDPAGPFINDSHGFFNETLELDRNLTITRGATFRIYNSNITFADNRSLGLYVESNGTLWIEDSTITGKNPQNGFYFEVYGNLFVYNSRIMNIGGTDNKSLDGGIELYDANCVMEDSFVGPTITNGILAAGSDLKISSCQFANCGDDTIELHWTDAHIENCRFVNNSWAMVFWMESDAMVLNCTFENNSYGIWIGHSSPRIINNTFRNTQKGAAIGYKDLYSDPKFSDNTFVNNKRDFRKPEVDVFGYYYLTFGGPVLGISAFIFFYIRNKKIMKEEKGK